MTIVSAIQMTSTPVVKENLMTVETLFKEAVNQRSKLVVLPEMFPFFSASSAQDKISVAEDLGHGEIQDFLSHQAKKNHLWIVGGTIPLKSKDPNKVSGACLVFNDCGEIVAHYDKIHLFDVMINETESYQESATVVPGTKPVVIPTPFGKLGLAVCYDLRFPELFRHMFNCGAEIFAIPAAFTVTTGEAHWKLLARSRAVENFCYVIGACQSGTHANDRKTYGHSLIINPWGEVISELASGVGVISAEINLKLLEKIRRDIPVAYHQKIQVDLSGLEN